MKSICNTFALLAITFAGLTTTRAQDPHPSWNDTAPKKAIVAFVEKVTKEDSSDFVPPAERIATFDNDGTMWCEQPVVELVFTKDRLNALVAKDPTLKEKQPFKSRLGRRSRVFREDWDESCAGIGRRHARQHVSSRV
jgi:hypothetical protein